MKKLIITCSLLLCMIFVLQPTTAYAAENIASGTYGNNLTWFLDTDGVLTISGTGDMPAAGRCPWADYYDQIDSVVVNPGITSISNQAFMRFTNLTQVDLPSGLKSIGWYAFAHCSSLTEITIPDTVTKIEYDAFANCSALTSISIPNSVKTLNSNVFGNCTSLKEVSLSGNLTTIPTLAFYGCTALEQVVIPEKVSSIEGHAFSECTSLTEIIFTGSAPSFNEYVFENVTATAFYPLSDSTWTKSVRKNYGGDITWTGVGPASAPVVKSSSDASSGKPKLTWDAVDGAVQYHIYRASSKNGTYKLLETVATSPLIDETAVAGKAYYYYVVGADEDGFVSRKSNTVSRTCDLSRPEVTLTNLASSGKIKVSWEKVDGAAEYKVYRATSKTGTYSLMKTTTSLSYTNTSAAAGKTYYYKVRAIADNTAANSAYSEVKSRTCDLARPSVTLSNVASTGKIKVSWKTIDGAVKYQVYRAESEDGEYKLVKTTTSTSYTNTSAEAGNAYYYKVMAVASKSSANSAYSTAKGRTCDLERPDVTIKLKSGKPRLTWDEVEGAVEYKVYRATSKSGTYSLVKTTTSTSYTNTGAKSGKTYYYKVKAIAENTAANSAYSSIDSIKSK